MDRMLKSKKNVQVTLSFIDAKKMKDAVSKWICTSIRPFNIIADVDLQDVLQSVLDIGTTDN